MEGRASITTEIDTSFPDNNSKFITALLMREFQEVINISKFNLVDDDMFDINFSDANFNSTNAGDALVEIYDLTIGGNNLSYGTLPLFYVEFDITTTSSGLVHTLNSFTSNNATVAVAQSNPGNAADIWTISYTETYDTTSQIGKFVYDNILQDSYYVATSSGGTLQKALLGTGSIAYSSKSMEPDIGNPGNYIYRVYFFSGDLIYKADL